MLLNEDIADIEKLDGMYSLTFVVDEFSGLLLHTSIFSVKVAHVVNLKLAFTAWLFYNLTILIKLCKIWYLNLDKAILLPRSQVNCLKN